MIFYVPGFLFAIKLLLRRTLQLSDDFLAIKAKPVQLLNGLL